jgi:diadenosine tetraphosphate (Ap4A) HIT family hydrolase
MSESAAESYQQIVDGTRHAVEGECPECVGVAPEQIVWEDQNWVLSRPNVPSALAAALLLQTREHSRVGQLDDDLASQFGRISNRLVRIIENLPEASFVDVNRYGANRGHFHVWYFAQPSHAGASVDLHAVATKLANWGGDARA